MEYNLENRTALFGESIIELAKTLKQDSINSPLIKQIVRSATSVGSNYCEANNASSKRDFRNKIFICKKEASETKHWLRMVAMANQNRKEKCKPLWKEANELTMIFSKIITSISAKE